mgnify:CR=1 FL=1
MPEYLINVRTICHPTRITLDSKFLNKYSTSIIAPISSMPDQLKNYLNSENKFILDFGLHVNGEKKIDIYLQNRFKEYPKYEIIEEDDLFICKVKKGEEIISEANGNTKKKAEQNAAKASLIHYGVLN